LEEPLNEDSGGQAPSAPDAPEESRDRDALGRWPIARMIYDLISGAPLHWPLRVGVYGKWGEGKTTVLRFLEAIAKDEGNVSAWFNPQGCHSRSELWSAFYFALSKPLGAPGHWKSALRPITKWSMPLVKQSSSAHPFAAICAGLIEPLANQLEISQSEVARLIRTRLGNKRLFIFIDDLDRTAPDLVPDLLLSLQQFLGFPQCAFIFALDPGVIADALPKVHPGWGRTEQFLEKFIDFPFWLPRPTREQTVSLLTAASTTGAVRLNIDAIGDVLDLLPDNPRRIKLFVRRFWRLKPQLARHDPEEIDWHVLYILELLRALAPRSLKALVGNRVFLEDLMMDQLLGRRQAERQGDGSRPTEDKWRATAEQSGRRLDELEDLELGEMVGLIKALRDRLAVLVPDKITYLERLGDSPDIFTWKEIRELLATWRADPGGPRLLELVGEQARSRGTSACATFEELFGAMILHRQGFLERAASSIGEAEMRSQLLSAEVALRVIELIGTLDPEGLGASHLKPQGPIAFYRQCAEWAHFTNHPDYLAARARERLVLRAVLDRVSESAVEVLEAIEAWRPEGTGMEKPGETELRGEAIAQLCPTVYQLLIRRFERPGGISALWPDEGHLVEKYYLFDPGGGFYSQDTLATLGGIAGKARESADVHGNFVEMVRMIGHGLGGAIGPVIGDTVRDLIRIEQVRATLWMGATAARMQPRTLGSFMGTRATIAGAIGTQDALPLPDWWDGS